MKAIIMHQVKWSQCMLCEGNCSEKNYLTNGYSYHARCFAELKDGIDELGISISNLYGRIAETKSLMQRADTLLFSITSFFTRETVDIPALEATILDLNSQIDVLRDRKTDGIKRLISIYDYWPDYPPDWGDRKRRARAETQGCSNPECRLRVRKRHVHHITPVSRGGSHKPDNLMVLCIKCHKRAHGDRDFNSEHHDVMFRPENLTREPIRLLPTRRTSKKRKFEYRHDPERTHNVLSPQISPKDIAARPDSDSKPESVIRKRIQKVRSALYSNQLLHFEYTKLDGSKSERTIRPEQIKKVETTLCISGYCYLRGRQRTFAIKRMRRVAVVRKVGNCADF